MAKTIAVFPGVVCQKLLKSANVSRSYSKNISDTFLWTTVHVPILFRHGARCGDFYRRSYSNGSHSEPSVRTGRRSDPNFTGNWTFHSSHHRRGRLPRCNVLCHRFHTRLRVAGCGHLSHWNHCRQRARGTARYRHGGFLHYYCPR